MSDWHLVAAGFAAQFLGFSLWMLLDRDGVPNTIRAVAARLRTPQGTLARVFVYGIYTVANDLLFPDGRQAMGVGFLAGVVMVYLPIWWWRRSAARRAEPGV